MEENNGFAQEKISISRLESEDAPWVIDFLQEQWASPLIVSRGRVHEAHMLPGFAACQGSNKIGLITYVIENQECEIVTLNSLTEGLGIGTELLKEVLKVAVEEKCKRAWAVITNDNVNSLRFFQTRGFVIAALYRNAIEEARRLKPEIPARGSDNIPIRDEIEVEMQLT